MLRPSLIALILAGLSAGCASRQDLVRSGMWWRFYKSLEYSYPLNSEAERKEAVRLLNKQASEPSENPRSRAQAIFHLFRLHIRPGFRSADFRSIMEQAQWLDQVNIQLVGGLGGNIPLDWTQSSSVFSMAVVPDERGWSEWFIYFSLSGLERSGWLSREECRKRALDFLKGNLPDNRVRLHEFALCFPREERDKTERFTSRGAGLQILDQ